MSKPQLIIFDMDGLMIDTEPLAIAGWGVVSKELNITIPEELFPRLIGLNRELCKTIMLECLGPDFDFDTALGILYKSVDLHFEKHGVPLKPGLLHLLTKLEEAGIKKCVATSTPHARAMHKLNLAGIAHRFDAIIGGDQVAHSKPAPDIFLKAADTCGIGPENCIVLEDSNPGAEGAHRAGMRVIVVPDLVPPTDVTRKNAYAVCEDLFGAWEVIGKCAIT